VDLDYNNPAHKHAVTHLNDAQKYTYDANGNMVTRNAGSNYTLTYDQENRLVGVSGAATASFLYDADGQRVKGTAGGVTTAYVGGYYEKSGSTIRKYYTLGGQRVAMRENGVVSWLLTDALGSTANTTGSKAGELRYKAYGATRYTWGTTPTTYRYTGQREEASIGLYYYNARWYDPALGRFIQPDTIVPEPVNPQSLNRYAYCLNNPVKYNDPSGHDPLDETWREAFRNQHPGVNLESIDELIRLFQLAYPEEWFGQGLWSVFYADNGRGAAVYSEVRDYMWTPPPSRSWDTMPAALTNLSRYYKKGEEADFVQDVAFMYAGLPGRSQDNGSLPYWSSSGFPDNIIVYIQPGSIDRSLIQTTTNRFSDPDANVHHWAWAFALGYNIGPAASAANAIREITTSGNPLRVDRSDVEIGSRGAAMGLAMSWPWNGYSQIPGLFERHLGIGGTP
jgi:RHS repeat-associated protein